jgi:hypothetical protein
MNYVLVEVCITFIQIVFLTEDSCSSHIHSTLMMVAASSTEMFVTIIRTSVDILNSSVHLNRDNFKSRASFILCFMRRG